MELAILGARGFPSTYGGYETLVRYVAPDWSRKGHNVTVYCRTYPQGRRRATIDGVRCVWTPGYDSQSLSTLTYGCTSSIHAALKKCDAALVLNIANGYWLPMLRAAGVPTVVNTDGIEWERGKWGPIARRVFKAGAWITARAADVLVADSEAIGSIWKKEFGVQSVYIPYGGDVDRVVGSTRIEELGLRRAGYALVVARLVPENNVSLTLDAMEYLGSDALPLVVVGSASAPNALEARVRDLSQSGRLLWLGHVADPALLDELWANSAVYVHGHSVGGTNPALLQALGLGAPTLALDTPFNREVLGVGSDDQLFEPKVLALAKAITRVTGDSSARRVMASRGQETISRRFSWIDVSDRYLDALRLAGEQTRSR